MGAEVLGTDANLFSSRNSMALIIDNETLIISLNVLIKSPLNLV